MMRRVIKSDSDTEEENTYKSIWRRMTRKTGGGAGVGRETVRDTFSGGIDGPATMEPLRHQFITTQNYK